MDLSNEVMVCGESGRLEGIQVFLRPFSRVNLPLKVERVFLIFNFSFKDGLPVFLICTVFGTFSLYWTLSSEMLLYYDYEK